MINRDSAKNTDAFRTPVKSFPWQEKSAQEDTQKAEKPIPFKCLSELITDFVYGSLVVLASRPGIGKTSFALDIAKLLTANKHKNIVFFSLEMYAEQVNTLLRIKDSNAQAIDTNILIYDDSHMTVTDMERKCKNIENLVAVIIDYVQLIDCNQEATRKMEIACIARELKTMAQNLNVPVICLSQLSKAVEYRADKHPIISDLCDDGILAQEADQILLLYRDRYYNPETPLENITECIIAKNRYGDTGRLILQWNPERQTFSDIED